MTIRNATTVRRPKYNPRTIRRIDIGHDSYVARKIKSRKRIGKHLLSVVVDLWQVRRLALETSCVRVFSAASKLIRVPYPKSPTSKKMITLLRYNEYDGSTTPTETIFFFLRAKYYFLAAVSSSSLRHSQNTYRIFFN